MQAESNRGPVSDPLILAFRFFDCFVTWFPGRPSEELKVMRLALTMRVERRGKGSSCSRRSRLDPSPGLSCPLISSSSHRNSPPVLPVLSTYPRSSFRPPISQLPVPVLVTAPQPKPASPRPPYPKPSSIPPQPIPSLKTSTPAPASSSPGPAPVQGLAGLASAHPRVLSLRLGSVIDEEVVQRERV